MRAIISVAFRPSSAAWLRRSNWPCTAGRTSIATSRSAALSSSISCRKVVYELAIDLFALPKALGAEHARTEAQRHFGHWFPAAISFLQMARFARDEGMVRQAAFNLRQATEHGYHTLLMVRALYSLWFHNIESLRNRAQGMQPPLALVWPDGSKFTRRCFRLLKEAYVESR